MASFRRLEVWTDVECNGGVRVASFGPRELSQAVLQQSLTNPEQLQFTTARRFEKCVELIPARIIRVCWSDATLDTEWRLADDLTQSGNGDTGQLQWTAYNLILDLNRAPFVTWDILGAVVTQFGAVQLDAEDWINGFVLPACVEGNLFPLAVGTIDFANQFDLSGDYQTAGQMLQAIIATGNAPGDCFLRKNGATNYLIDIRTQRGSDAAVVRVQATRNLLSNVRKRQLATVGTKIQPRGDATSICRDMGRAYWLVTNITGTVVTLADPLGGDGPVAFDDQLDNLYVSRLAVTFSSQLVTASNAAAQTITVASVSGWSVGDRVEFRRTSGAAGQRLPFLSHPVYSKASSAGGFGARTLILDVPAVVGDCNLLPNPWARAWANHSNPPDGWTSMGAGGSGGTFSRETTLTQFGGQAYRWAGESATPREIYGPVFHPYAGGDQLYTAHLWLYVATNADASLYLTVWDVTGAVPLLRVALGAVATGEWFKATVTGLSFAAYTAITLAGGIRVGLTPLFGATTGVSLDYIVDAVSFSEAETDIADVEASGGTALWQAANTRLAVSSTPVGGYTVAVADLARMDGSAWGDEPLVLGGDVEIVDKDIDDTTLQRITDLSQDLLSPLSSTVQLANPNPLITSLIAAAASGVWTAQSDLIRRAVPVAANLGIADAGAVGELDPRYMQTAGGEFIGDVRTGNVVAQPFRNPIAFNGVSTVTPGSGSTILSLIPTGRHVGVWRFAIAGEDGTNSFYSEVVISAAGVSITKVPVDEDLVGSPAARTYSFVGGVFLLTLGGSGAAYTIRVQQIAFLSPNF